MKQVDPLAPSIAGSQAMARINSYLIASSFRFDNNHIPIIREPKYLWPINFPPRPGSNKKMINVCVCVACVSPSALTGPGSLHTSSFQIASSPQFFFFSFFFFVRLPVCLSVARNSIVQVINYTYKIIRLNSQHEIWNGAERWAHLDRKFMHAAECEHRKLATARIRQRNVKFWPSHQYWVIQYIAFFFQPACARYFILFNWPKLRYLRAIFYWAIIFVFLFFFWLNYVLWTWVSCRDNASHAHADLRHN